MNNLIGKFVSVWLKPWAAMAAVKEEGGEASIKPSLIFIVVMGVISGLITAVMGMIFPPAGAGAVPAAVNWLAIVIVPIVSVLGSFIGAFILWGFVFGLLKGTGAQYKTTYRLLALLAAFSPVSALLSPIPTVGAFIGIAINLWATIVMIRGLIIVHETAVVRTWVICGIFFGLLFLLGITARFAAQQQLAGGGFGDTNAGFDFDEDELNAQLEALREDIEANQPGQ